MQTPPSMQATDTEFDTGYDEGLVHGHDWACSGAEQIVAQAEQQPQSAWRDYVTGGRDEDEAYDDGLVHDHGWACSR